MAAAEVISVVEEHEEQQTMPVWQIVLIVIGSIFVLAALIALGFFVSRHVRASRWDSVNNSYFYDRDDIRRSGTQLLSDPTSYNHVLMTILIDFLKNYAGYNDRILESKILVQEKLYEAMKSAEQEFAHLSEFNSGDTSLEALLDKARELYENFDGVAQQWSYNQKLIQKAHDILKNNRNNIQDALGVLANVRS